MNILNNIWLALSTPNEILVSICVAFLIVVTILSKSCLKPLTLSCKMCSVLLYSSALSNFLVVVTNFIILAKL